MHKYNFVVIDNNNYFPQNFFIKERFGEKNNLEKLGCYKEFRNFIELESFLKNNFVTFTDKAVIVLWHLSSASVELPNLQNTIDKLKKYFPNAVLKVGKSQDEGYRKETERSKYFHFVLDRLSLEAEFDKYNWNIDRIVKKGIKGFNERVKKENVKNYFLMHFLPLDIDMQALKDAESPKVFLENMYEDIKVLYRLKKYDSKNINHHYRQKLYDLWYLLGQENLLKKIGEDASSKVKNLTPIDNPSEALLKIAGINNNDPKASQVYKFFESLDNARKMGDKDLTKTIKNLFNPFDIQIKEEKKKITTFHEWYCALDRYLRNETKS